MCLSLDKTVLEWVSSVETASRTLPLDSAIEGSGVNVLLDRILEASWQR